MAKVPKETSIYDSEPVLDKYSIGFAPELVEIILSGEKVITYRFGKKYDYLQIGDDVTILNSKTNKTVGKATITDKATTTFGELPLNARGHETYMNKEEQRGVLSGYYAYLGRPIKDDDEFLALHFELKK